MGEGAEEPPDETAYATRIEEAFIAERGTPFLLSATAKNDLRSQPSMRAMRTMLLFRSIAPTLNTQLTPRRVIRCGLVLGLKS